MKFFSELEAFGRYAEESLENLKECIETDKPRSFAVAPGGTFSDFQAKIDELAEVPLPHQFAR